jgi:dsDNA-specific endonuclease/ATPase MutS2
VPSRRTASIRRATSACAGIEELSKLIGEEWRKLTVSQRAPYQKLADKDQERYRKEMDKYTPSEEYLAAREAFKAAKKAGRTGAAALAFVGGDDHLLEENASLKRKVSELESEAKEMKKELKEVERAHKKIKTLEDKIEKLVEKAAAAKGKAAAKAAKPAAKAAKAPTDDAHYTKWCKKMLANGGKADKDVAAAVAAGNEKKLLAVLTKKYKAAHK